MVVLSLEKQSSTSSKNKQLTAVDEGSRKTFFAAT